jgi:AGZA family xanthine/uracil permease-like MFS transporter
MIIDRRLRAAAGISALMALFTLFGIVHSPKPGAPMFVPWPYLLPGREQLAAWQLGPEFIRAPLEYAAGYLLVAILLYAWGRWASTQYLPELADAK